MIKLSEDDSEELELLQQIDGIGSKIIGDIKAIFQNKDNILLIENLIKILNIQNNKDVISDSALSQRIVVFSGTMASLSEQSVKILLKIEGARVASNVSKNTDFLIIGESPGSKLKAIELNIKVIAKTNGKR